MKTTYFSLPENAIINIKPFTPSSTDAVLTVSQIAKAKVASNGIIYFTR